VFAAPVETVTTTSGDVPAAELRRRLISIDDENEFTSIVEYRPRGSDEIVHRSVDVKLKQLPAMGGTAGGIG